MKHSDFLKYRFKLLDLINFFDLQIGNGFQLANNEGNAFSIFWEEEYLNYIAIRSFLNKLLNHFDKHFENINTNEIDFDIFKNKIKKNIKNEKQINRILKLFEINFKIRKT